MPPCCVFCITLNPYQAQDLGQINNATSFANLTPTWKTHSNSIWIKRTTFYESCTREVKIPYWYIWFMHTWARGWIRSAKLAAIQDKLCKNVHFYPRGCLLWLFPRDRQTQTGWIEKQEHEDTESTKACGALKGPSSLDQTSWIWTLSETKGFRGYFKHVK